MKIFIKGSLLILAGILIGSLALAGCAAPAPAPAPTPAPAPAPAPTPTPAPAQAPAVIKWKMASLYPPGRPNLEIIDILTQQVKDRSGGRLEIENFPGSALVSTTEHYDALSSGTIAMAFSAGPYYEGKIPEAGIEMSLPYTWSSFGTIMNLWYEKGIYQILRDTYAKHNIYYLSPSIIGGYSWFSTKPITSVNDLKGMKMRAVGMWGKYVESLGGTATNLAPAETPMGLKLGTIDGIITGVTSVITDKLYESLVSAIPNILAVEAANILVSMDDWNKLPDDLKDVLEWTATENNARMRAHIGPLDELCFAEAATYGLKTVNLSPEDMKIMVSKAAEIWDIFAQKSPECANLVQLVKDYYKERGLL